jgi:CubicO group peptidase (beta-lactamase class C family)
MPENTDLARNSLEDLLCGVAKSSKGKQAIIAVDAPKQSFRWTGSTGKTETGEPISEKTPFFIASIDKLYNATIAMMLAESGTLDVDQSICNYLPATITRGLHQDGGRDRTAEITLRHLLTHTSGLPDWFEDYPKGGSSLASIVLEEGDRMLSIEELAGHVRDSLRPHFPPQELAAKHRKIRYSDTNFILMAEIIEAVTGQPLHEVHQRMLYEPFGLSQTYFPGQSQPLMPTSAPMVLRANGKPLHIPLLIKSVKGIYSTAADMMKFIRRLMQCELFGNPETLTAMMSRWHRFGFPMDRAALRSPNWPIEYAIGMMRFRVPRLFTLLAPMPEVVGHTGSTGCWLFYCPELEVMIAGSVEDAAAGAVPFRITPEILKILFQSGWQAHNPQELMA